MFRRGECESVAKENGRKAELRTIVGVLESERDDGGEICRFVMVDVGC